MHANDAISKFSYKGLSNGEGAAGSCNATVQQSIAKIPWETVKVMIYHVAYLNWFVKPSLIDVTCALQFSSHACSMNIQ